MKKILIAFFVAFFVLSCTAFAAVVESGECGDNLTWALDGEGTLIIGGTGNMEDYYGAVSSPWYDYRSSIKNAVVENGVTSIGASAFYDCYNLISVKIPNGVTSVGKNAFYYCTGLTSIEIPGSITDIGDSAFYNCENLTSNIVIPKGVKSIGGYTFYGCEKLMSIEIPDSVTSIGIWAFYDCKKLTSIKIPDSVTSIENYAFTGCEYLTSIVLPKSVTSIGKRVFNNGCISLERIDVDPDNPNYYSDEDGVLYNRDKTCLVSCPQKSTKTDGVKSIGNAAFNGCIGITRIEIPNSVISVEEDAFSYCKKLTSIKIPDSITSIDDGAFDECTNLEIVYYNGTEEEWNEIEIGYKNDALFEAEIIFNGVSENVIDEKDGNDIKESSEIKGLQTISVLEFFVNGENNVLIITVVMIVCVTVIVLLLIVGVTIVTVVLVNKKKKNKQQ